METPSTTLRRSGSHWGAFGVEVRDGRAVGIVPFAKDPNPSPIIDGIVDSVYGENRIAGPAVRAGWLEHGPGARTEGRGRDPFVPVPWDEALDLVAGELRRVKERHGNTAIYAGSYGWGSAGTFHKANRQLYRFLNGFGGFVDRWDSYSFAAGMVIMPHVIGTRAAVVGPHTSWPSIVENTRLVVMFGGLPLKNTQVEHGGVAQHTSETWLRRAKEAGVAFVNISPIADDAPAFLDAEWLAPRPNSDTALLLGLAHTLVEENRHDRDFLERYSVGFERFHAYLTGESDGQPKDAEWAAPISGIEADAIRALARRMASTRTMITMTWSLQRGDHGEQPFWMAVVLAAMLGQIGLPGGGVGFGYGCESAMGAPRRWTPIPELPIGVNPTGAGIPVARISDMLLQPGASYDYNGRTLAYPDVRLVYWCGGNPFHHHQDLNRLIEAWRRPETIVVHEPWWTATARRADIVLPATTPLERNDIGASSRDRFLLVMETAIEPVGDARSDHDIFAGLARRLGFADAFTEGRSEMEWLRHLYDVAHQQAARQRIDMPDFDTFWRDGHVEVPEPAAHHVLLEAFRRDPDAHPLKTPSGRIEICSETIEGFGYDDCPAHPVWMEPGEWLGSETAARYPLHLLSNQPATRLHGQLDDGRVSRASKVNGREPVRMHPDDAAARGIGDGDTVRVHNDRGALLAGAVISRAIRPGVIQLATGGAYDPLEPGTAGSLEKHGNPNVLTLDKGTSRLAQGPTAHSTLVEVERYDGEVPDVTAFTPPDLIERRRPAGKA